MAWGGVFPWGAWGRRAVAATTLAAVLAGAGPAAGQGLPHNRYSIDLFQGPILAPADVIGIGGAYAGYAEGIVGMVTNAAAPAVRAPFSVDYLDYDFSGSFSVPLPLFAPDDFDNSGSSEGYKQFLFGTAGGLVQYGPFGAGANLELQRYKVHDSQIFVGKYHLLAGFRFLGDQLMVGGGVRMVSLSVDAPEANLSMFGAAPQIGVLVRPDWQSFRVGATFRFPVDGGALTQGRLTPDPESVRRAGGLVLPDHVVLPWELEVGVVVQVGPRPINPEWVNPHDQEEELHRSFERRRKERHAEARAEVETIADPLARAAREKALADEEPKAREREEKDEERVRARLTRERRARYANWPRQHLLFSADLLLTGSVANGVSIQSFLRQDEAKKSLVGTYGATLSFSPRLGVEGEPVPGWVHTRAGTYYEPSRYSARAVGRQHFTFGADVRVFSTTFWGLVPEVTYKVQAYADLAPRYQSLSAGIGVWR